APAGGGGPRVWLVAASHVGESNYFAALQRRLDGCDRVLFEGGGAKSGMHVEPPDEGAVQHTLAVSLGLGFQFEALHYDRPQFRNSDLTIPQLQELIRQGLSGEAGAEAQEEFEGLLQVMEGSSMLGTLVHAGLKLIGSSPKLREMTKLVLIETLGGVKGDLAQLRTLPPSFQRLFSVIIQERNQVVLRDLASELRGPDRPRSIAV